MGVGASRFMWIYKELIAAESDETASYRFVENIPDEGALKVDDIGDFVTWHAMPRQQYWFALYAKGI